jgi:hypothetical protein
MKLKVGQVVGIAWMMVAALGQAAASEDEAGTLFWRGDLRLRYESDFDGTGVDDRHRGRMRARVGADYQFNPSTKLGARLRTGNRHSQQSALLTFVNDQGADNDPLDFVLDQLYVAFDGSGWNAWAGRNAFPFWKQNELFWDDDVTLTGASGDINLMKSPGNLTGSVGVFKLPDGGYGLHGLMSAGQIMYRVDLAETVRLTSSAGIYRMDGREGASYLRNGNGARDYLIGSISLQLKCNLGGMPVALGADCYSNLEDYSPESPDSFTAMHHDEKDGYVLSIVVGGLDEPGDWLLGYYNARIEALAVNASFAQDDWLRFGGRNGQTDSSDFKGHEFRIARAISESLNLTARYFVVDALSGVRGSNRFRLDLNWAF